jgi:hypothetical protein
MFFLTEVNQCIFKKELKYAAKPLLNEFKKEANRERMKRCVLLAKPLLTLLFNMGLSMHF